MNKNPTNMLTQTQIMDALNRRHSPEKQRLLSEGHVAIAGLGGLGSNVACALARIGVGHLHLIDFDVVDITNLNRQQYFIGQLGMNLRTASSSNSTTMPKSRTIASYIPSSRATRGIQPKRCSPALSLRPKP